MNVGSATRRYLPVGVTARRKLRCFYLNEERNSSICPGEKGSNDDDDDDGNVKGEKEKKKEKEASRPDTSVINPFRYETFESKGFVGALVPARRRICLYTLDIVLS